MNSDGLENTIKLEHPCVIDGWFNETESSLWPGQRFSLKVEEILRVEKTKYQELLMFRSTSYGVVLVLDGVVQVTERDECAYHEMMACVPLACRPAGAKAATRALVVGGGDGGVVRELIQAAPTLTYIDLVEIDPAVIDACRRFMPSVACALDDKRVSIHVDIDGLDYIRDYQGPKYDVIVSDSTDPVGAGESLFSCSFYRRARECLCPDAGVFCSIGECMWLHAEMIRNNLNIMRVNFKSAMYGAYSHPSYPCGSMGLLVGCVSAESKPNVPTTNVHGAKYYTSELHASVFVMPKFVADELRAASKNL